MPNHNNNTTAIPEAILHQAREWFILLQDNPSRFNLDACKAWCDASEIHQQAYLSVQQSWHKSYEAAQSLAHKEEDILAVYLKKMDQPVRQSFFQRWRTIGGLSFACLFILTLTWFYHSNLINTWNADYKTAVGEQKSIQLADGSIIFMDTDTAIKQSYTDKARNITLLQGRASFEVTKSHIPFIVQVDDGAVRVYGTKFDIEKKNDGGFVALERGSISFTLPGSQHEIMLRPGQQLAFQDNTAYQIDDANIPEITSWQNQRYVFYRTSLNDIIHTLSRYQSGKIIILSPYLSAQLFTGNVALNNIDQAIEALQTQIKFKTFTLGKAVTFIY